jgi:hypothetical protein
MMAVPDALDMPDSSQSELDARASTPDAEPSRSTTVTFAILSSRESVSLPAKLGGVVVDSAVLSVHEMYVVSDTGRLGVEGKTVDLGVAAGVVTMTLPAASAGLFSRVSIGFEPADDGATIPPALQGQRLSARVAGHLESGAPFVIRDAAEFRIDLLAPTPLDLKPGAVLRVRIAFDIAGWFAGISFPLGQTPVDVDSGHSADILARFRANLVQSASLAFE